MNTPAPGSSKQLWVLAGGNGAGKSTFHQIALAPWGVKLINADLIAKIINPEDPETVSYEAAGIAERIREALLRQGTSFCFETVFSHPSKIDFIAMAKGLGYEVILVYIHLSAPELNEARVYQRVSEGGHNVPVEKIHERLPRTMRYVAAALPLVDEARLLDNSSRSDPYQQVAVIQRGRLVWNIEPLPRWARQICAAAE
ncbi:MAG: zeta toxin family protein [Desulfobacteraceae bacterium]|nr:zeta toxin family protein [Desulfobacteraceae bacterium]